jgi:molybdate transport system substrate-binding protein
VRSFLFTILSLNFLAWGGNIKIATSANLGYVINPLIKEFQKTHPKIKIQKIVSSSGKLTSQIIHKAPFDIFLSADMKYPNRLYQLHLSSKPKVYAKGILVIFSKKTLDLSKNIKVLEEDFIQKVAIANPKLAPYGRASIEALQNAKIYPKVKKKLLFADSISQTLTYSLKITDIGLIAKSLLFAPKMKNFKEKKNWVEVEKTLYSPILQGAVIINQKSKEAKEFFEFLFTKEAKKILKNYGYLVE